jgi:hypothetical protein
MFGEYLTVQLTKPISGLRVHTEGRAFPPVREFGSAQAGVWILIGDVIQTSVELAGSRSLPVNDPSSMVAFTHTSLAKVQAGSILNIGLASRLFGGSGGEYQAEFISGPPIEFVPLAGKHWHGRFGTT